MEIYRLSRPSLAQRFNRGFQFGFDEISKLSRRFKRTQSTPAEMHKNNAMMCVHSNVVVCNTNDCGKRKEREKSFYSMSSPPHSHSLSAQRADIENHNGQKSITRQLTDVTKRSNSGKSMRSRVLLSIADFKAFVVSFPNTFPATDICGRATRSFNLTNRSLTSADDVEFRDLFLMFDKGAI